MCEIKHLEPLTIWINALFNGKKYSAFDKYAERNLPLMDKSLKMTFRVGFSEDFEQREFATQIIEQWQYGTTNFVLKSSGSTGLPKEISLNRQLLIWSSEQTAKRLGLSEEHILCCIPIDKTGGFMQLIRALHLNYKIFITKPKANPLSTLKGDDYTIISLTPYQLQTIFDESPEKLANFRNVLIGGAAIEADLLQRIENFKGNTTFWETYGMTETASHFALKNLSQGETEFTVNEGVKLNNEQGELTIEIPKLNFKVSSTDLIVLSKNGFRVLGRSDDVINSGGVKIHPLIVEPQIGSLLKQAGIERGFYLVGEKDEQLGETATLVMEGPELKDEGFILELLRRELPKYMAPKRIAYTTKLRRTDTGKLMRRLPGS